MSAYVDAIVASLKQDAVPAAQIVENLILAALKDLPMLLPAADQALVQGLDDVLVVAAKTFLDSQIAKLAPSA